MKKKLLLLFSLISKALSLLPKDQCGYDCRSCTIHVGDIDCFECVEGYKLIDRKCVGCHLPGCSSCDEFLHVCQSCKFGYYNSSRPGTGGFTYVENCTSCMTGCKICKNTTQCMECYEGYKMEDDMSCTSKKMERYIDLAKTHGPLVVALIIFVIVASYIFCCKGRNQRRKEFKEWGKGVKDKGKEKKVLKKKKKSKRKKKKKKKKKKPQKEETERNGINMVPVLRDRIGNNQGSEILNLESGYNNNMNDPITPRDGMLTLKGGGIGSIQKKVKVVKSMANNDIIMDSPVTKKKTFNRPTSMMNNENVGSGFISPNRSNSPGIRSLPRKKSNFSKQYLN